MSHNFPVGKLPCIIDFTNNDIYHQVADIKNLRSKLSPTIIDFIRRFVLRLLLPENSYFVIHRISIVLLVRCATRNWTFHICPEEEDRNVEETSEPKMLVLANNTIESRRIGNTLSDNVVKVENPK